MGFSLDDARNALLLQAKTVEVTLYNQTFKIAPTPPGAGLVAYMNLINRNNEIYNEYGEKTDNEEENKANLEAFVKAKLENQSEDAQDTATALFWSASRIDPTFDLDAIKLLIDSTNLHQSFMKLVEVNRRDDTGEIDPNAPTPTETTGSATMESNGSTQASTETN